MAPRKIMIIRHAEKPNKDAGVFGVRFNGAEDKDSLSPQGWRRAGGLVRFFNPDGHRFADPLLARPEHIFAARFDPESGARSRRMIQTVSGLAESLKIPVNQIYGKGEEAPLARAALACKGPVLICWSHRFIRDIALGLGASERFIPMWPEKRFDLVWVFDLHDASCAFSQAPQLLFADDRLAAPFKTAQSWRDSAPLGFKTKTMA